MKVLWDCKLRFAKPTVEVCWELVCESISTLKANNKKFLTLWNASGLIL